MKDQIIAAYMADFVSQHGYGNLNESEAFERFANYCLISKHYPDSFDPDDVSVGGGNDLGLDGVAILVNDHLISSIEDIEFFKKTLRRLDVQFVFIQSKTTAAFEAAAVGTFLSGVRAFFESSLRAPANQRVRAAHALKSHIYNSTIDMDRSPSCRLYYATLGTWLDDPTVRDRIAQGVADLERTNLFSQVHLIPVDAEALKRFHRELNHRITREITFEKHTILPQINGVQEAYIGIVPCHEYLNLICDEEGHLNRRLFYDNVRDFQGQNAVNQEIDATARDGERNDRFALLNNGVTIVAREANKVGAVFKLRDYQIVNGCQTSHILYLNREHLTNRVFLPVKLIVTTDIEVTNQIIQGTNRQTEVKLEAFESLAPFQKLLEEFYVAVGRGKPQSLFYERRSKQYEHLDLRRDRIISLATQIKCFVAMFLNEPHSTHRYYSELLSSYRSRLFGESHSPWPYYLSGTAYAVMERLFADGSLPRTLRPFKYQLLMVIRLLRQTKEPPYLNSKEMEAYCQTLLDLLDDRKRAIQSFQAAGELILSSVQKEHDDGNPTERRREFTARLLDAASPGSKAKAAVAARERGTVKAFSDVKGYGFIVGPRKEELFVHFTAILGPTGWRTLTPGQSVEYTPTVTDKGKQAQDVVLL